MAPPASIAPVRAGSTIRARSARSRYSRAPFRAASTASRQHHLYEYSFSRFQQFLCAGQPALQMARRVFGIIAQHIKRGLSCRFYQYRILKIGILEQRQPALSRADELTRTAQMKIVARDFETVAV